MSADDRRALFGPHAVLHRHRHRRSHTARPAKEVPVNKPPLSKPPLIAGGQGRTASDVSASAEAMLVALMTAGVVALIVILGHVAGWLA